MEVSVPASPSRVAGLRQAVRADLRGVSDEVADDVVLALHEAATNAVLYGSSAGQPIQWSSTFTMTGLKPRCWIMARSRHPASQQTATPTSCALAGGACGCCAGWSMRYALSTSSSAPA
jgi:hypothetical protein